MYWSGHACRPSFSTQYRSLILVHDETQRKLAQERLDQESASRKVYVELRPVTFWPAEDYHQKYYLRQTPALMREFARMYPDGTDLMNSTAAARVNGYLGGGGVPAEALDRLGLSPEGQRYLREVTSGK